MVTFVNSYRQQERLQEFQRLILGLLLIVYSTFQQNILCALFNMGQVQLPRHPHPPPPPTHTHFFISKTTHDFAYKMYRYVCKKYIFCL